MTLDTFFNLSGPWVTRMFTEDTTSVNDACHNACHMTGVWYTSAPFWVGDLQR